MSKRLDDKNDISITITKLSAYCEMAKLDSAHPLHGIIKRRKNTKSKPTQILKIKSVQTTNVTPVLVPKFKQDIINQVTLSIVLALDNNSSELVRLSTSCSGVANLLKLPKFIIKLIFCRNTVTRLNNYFAFRQDLINSHCVELFIRYFIPMIIYASSEIIFVFWNHFKNNAKVMEYWLINVAKAGYCQNFKLFSLTDLPSELIVETLLKPNKLSTDAVSVLLKKIKFDQIPNHQFYQLFNKLYLRSYQLIELIQLVPGPIENSEDLLIFLLDHEEYHLIDLASKAGWFSMIDIADSDKLFQEANLKNAEIMVRIWPDFYDINNGMKGFPHGTINALTGFPAKIYYGIPTDE